MRSLKTSSIRIVGVKKDVRPGCVKLSSELDEKRKLFNKYRDLISTNEAISYLEAKTPDGDERIFKMARAVIGLYSNYGEIESGHMWGIIVSVKEKLSLVVDGIAEGIITKYSDLYLTLKIIYKMMSEFAEFHGGDEMKEYLKRAMESKAFRDVKNQFMGINIEEYEEFDEQPMRVPMKNRGRQKSI